MKTRTPRNFDGTFSPYVKIGDMLPELLREIGKNREVPREALFQEWQRLIGEKMAPMTEAISFENGVLTVIVKSSTLYSLLKAHERPRLLKKLQEKFQVKDLVFKIG